MCLYTSKMLLFFSLQKVTLQSSAEVGKGPWPSIMEEGAGLGIEVLFRQLSWNLPCFNPPLLCPSPPAPPFPEGIGIAFCGFSSVKCVVSHLVFAARL